MPAWVSKERPSRTAAPKQKVKVPNAMMVAICAAVKPSAEYAR